jgi:quinol-cytochrome oxidoreductase complex cytochrome b subunit
MAGHVSTPRRYNAVEQWIDDRLHIMPVLDNFIRHPVPKPVHPLDYLGECTLFAFINQAVTGILLAMFYHPVAQGNALNPSAASDAYLSIQNIMHSVPAGSFIRSLHFWGNYFMVVLVIMHALRGFFVGAYKYPRELTWLTGVGLLGLVLGFAFTGYLLPWDQKAFWATAVGINIAETIPLIGNALALLARGGPLLTGVTLGRFYAIHMLVLPALLGLLVGVHILLVTIQGISAADGLVLEDEVSNGYQQVPDAPRGLIDRPDVAVSGSSAPSQLAGTEGRGTH